MKIIFLKDEEDAMIELVENTDEPDKKRNILSWNGS